MKSSQQLVIVDTACANINSVRFACERLNIKVKVTADANIIAAADRVILPGVGSARAAMRNLEQLKLVNVLRGLEQPVLGICLGMQLLTDASAEGNVDCLGIIASRTERLQVASQPLPHMGWNTVIAMRDNPLLHAIPAASYFYFVHSYAVAVNAHTIASSHYGQEFAAMIQNRNYFGAQFHPERSGEVGAQLLKNFMELTDADTRP
jgi:imidazole glycerol-phosphate synthase subunit HisH